MKWRRARDNYDNCRQPYSKGNATTVHLCGFLWWILSVRPPFWFLVSWYSTINVSLVSVVYRYVGQIARIKPSKASGIPPNVCRKRLYLSFEPPRHLCGNLQTHTNSLVYAHGCRSIFRSMTKGKDIWICETSSIITKLWIVGRVRYRQKCKQGSPSLTVYFSPP